MAWWVRRRTVGGSAVALALLATVAPARSAHAQTRAQKAAAADPPNVAAAKKHAEHAHELYAQGAYREAIAELEEARKLDPSGKELVYNLGVVHEKLGDVDDALKAFRKYSAMDLTPEEREKTEAAIHRLEGAKREIEAKQEAERQRQLEEQKKAPPPPPAPPPDSPARGRIDAITIAAGAVTVVGFAVGIGFGVKALSDKPAPSGFVTGQDGSYLSLQDRATSAHHEAIVSDIGFGVGVAAGVTTALLFALRPKQAAKLPETGKAQSYATKPKPRAEVGAMPLPGGGAIVVHGAW